MVFKEGHGSYEHVPAMNVPITVEDALEVKEVLINPRYCAYPEQQVKLLCNEKATRQTIEAALDQRFGKWGCIQELELTIQKGIGAMAIALHRGKSPEEKLGSDDKPPTLNGSIREVDPAESQQIMQQILSGELTVSGTMNIVERDQVDLQNSQGAIVNSGEGTVIHQRFGDTTTINTGGGDYAGRDIHK